jgi:hypothetical protein
VNVVESIENFVKDGMTSMTMFGLRVPGLGTWKLKNANMHEAQLINNFDRLFITDKQFNTYARKREIIERTGNSVDIKESNNKSSIA